MHGFLWSLHKDHHIKDHKSWFERNDLFFIFYALVSSGFVILWGEANFWAGLPIAAGIFIYGMTYFLVHDVFIEKPTNSLELLDLLEKKTYLKRHITTLFLDGGLKKKCSFVAYYLGEESESIVFEFFDADKQIQEKQSRRKSTGGVVTAAVSKGLAHEIKNPLSGIKGAAQLLSNKLKTKENQELL